VVTLEVASLEPWPLIMKAAKVSGPKVDT
jgi:hypothetical protein